MNTKSGERKSDWGLAAVLFATRVVVDPAVFAASYLLTESVAVGAAGVAASEGFFAWATIKALGLK